MFAKQSVKKEKKNTFDCCIKTLLQQLIFDKVEIFLW